MEKTNVPEKAEASTPPPAGTGSKNDHCIICLDTITHLCRLVPCGHQSFDFSCIFQWLETKCSCPLCTAPVTSMQHGDPIGIITTFAPRSEENSILNPRAPTAPPIRQVLRQRRDPRRPRLSLGQGLSESTINDLHAEQTEGGVTWWWRSNNNAMSPAALARRREVYIYHRFSSHMGSNRISRYRELTRAMFVNDENLVSRARMFIRRELRVFAWLDSDFDSDDDGSAVEYSRAPSHSAGYILTFIIAILRTVDVMDSEGQGVALLTPHLGASRARLFLHELRAWLRSPYATLEEWDRMVQYSPALPYDQAAHLRGRMALAGAGHGRSGSGGSQAGQTLHRGDSHRPGRSGEGPSITRRRAPRFQPYGRDTEGPSDQGPGT